MRIRQSRQLVVFWGILLLLALFAPQIADAKTGCLNVRSAILIDTSDGKVLYEQNADSSIPPASVTKIITLYLVFEAIREGRVHLWDKVKISSRAAGTGGSRMCLRAGQEVPLEELIKGMAVASGNDACVAVAEHLCGSVEEFVQRMNAKARELGLVNTLFTTPNGLPSPRQTTTARDMAKLSLAYLRRFPDSLDVHSMKTYSYQGAAHRNANRLLGKCFGVDGIKTGFVCASGYNISATAKRGDVRLLAVVMGAPSPGVRAVETTKLLEAGFQKIAQGTPGVLQAEDFITVQRTILAGDAQKGTCSPSVGRPKVRKSGSIAKTPAVRNVSVRTVKALSKPVNMKLTSRYTRGQKQTEAQSLGRVAGSAGTGKPKQATGALSKKTPSAVAKTQAKNEAEPRRATNAVQAIKSKDQKPASSATKQKQSSPSLTKKSEPVQKSQPQAHPRLNKG